MPLLSAEALSLRYGPKVLFEQAYVSVEPTDRLGVVGPNGAGKSSLLEILAGTRSPDGGEVRRAKDVRIGYLSQEHADPSGQSLLEMVLDGAPGRDALEQAIARAEQDLQRTHDVQMQTELGGRLAELHEELSKLDVRFGPHEGERILMGLGFSEADFDRPLTAFSGGWRMRAALARLLFERNHVLILDEPTNHLDLPSTAWLSDFMDGLSSAILLTCHDRDFLNRHVNRVASLEVDGLKVFRGNYEAYLTQRELDLAQAHARWDKFQKKKKEIEGFIDRFRAKASKARQAGSKEKMIEKLEEELVEPPRPRDTMSIRFPAPARAGNRVLRVEGLSFGYAAEPLFDGLDLEVQRGQRVALVGLNGSGKTTLLKLLAGELAPRRGHVTLGSGVERRYFAQHQGESLEAGSSILKAVWELHPELSQTEVRALCGAFLFRGEEVDKSVDVLSGGERARVALARVLVKPGNLLLLDEPTNHLDTESADRLTASLEDWPGTLVFISHNLDFVRRLATTIWDVRGGAVDPYPGSFDDYLHHLREARRALYSPSARGERSKSASKEERIAARKADKARQAELRRLERSVAAAEASVSELEARKTELEVELADPETHVDAARSRECADALERTEAELAQTLDAWTELQERLERLGTEGTPRP